VKEARYIQILSPLLVLSIMGVMAVDLSVTVNEMHAYKVVLM